MKEGLLECHSTIAPCKSSLHFEPRTPNQTSFTTDTSKLWNPRKRNDCRRAGVRRPFAFIQVSPSGLCAFPLYERAQARWTRPPSHRKLKKAAPGFPARQQVLDSRTECKAFGGHPSSPYSVFFFPPQGHDVRATKPQ